MKLVRLLCASLAGMLLPGRAQAPAARADGPPAFADLVQPFFAKTCYECHGSKKSSGDLNLEALGNSAAVAEDPHTWDEILERLSNGEMPPAKRPRPDADELQRVTTWIKSEIERADSVINPDPGHVTARRLNRSEYNNTIRDLLGLDIDAAAAFPQDNSAYGFDNIAEALSTSPLLVEKYLAAAAKIARLAVFGPELKKPFNVQFNPGQPRRFENQNPVGVDEAPYYSMADYDLTGFSMPGSFHSRHLFPATGTYQLRFHATRGRPRGSEQQELSIWVDGKVVHTFRLELPKENGEESMKEYIVEFPIRLQAGRHEIVAAYPRLFEGLPAVMGGKNPSRRPIPPPPDPEKFLDPLPKDATAQQIERRKGYIARIRERQKLPPKFEGLNVNIIEFVGPFKTRKGPSPESVAKVFTCGHTDGHHKPSCERKIIGSLARRAFRRAVSRDEVNQLVTVSVDARARGRSFEQAIALALQTILVSPDFLYRIETGAGDAPGPQPVGQFELASRLSYFLWSSMPDDELLDCATRGTLADPKVLQAQVKRMLMDPRSRALVNDFAGQWLEVRRLEAAQPDRDRYPDFDDYLRDSMLEETMLFVANILQKDESVLDLISGEYSFLNERLARHYGIKGVTGNEFRRVPLAGTGRAGVITHASVLTVSSYNNRTSPVLRGKWILDNILNTPPPDPPPNVPALDEAQVGATVSLRQQLEQHRSNAVCASCHQRLDPLGFALENYNAIGLWRTHDGKIPIDPSGALPDGRPIKGVEDLKTIFQADRDAFTKGLAEKMLTYAVGRGVERIDRATIRKIADDVAAGGYRGSSLIMGIVNSVPFRMRAAERSKS